MDNKKDNLLSLPGVVGFGYGQKITHGQRLDREAIIVFVEKKRPLEELQDHEIIPLAIDDTETDVVQIGEVSANSQSNRDRKLFNHDFINELFEHFIIQDVPKIQRNDGLAQIIDTAKGDLEKINQVKETLTELNIKAYQNISQFTFQEFLDKVYQDLNKLLYLRSVLSEINLSVYKDAAALLVSVVDKLALLDKLQKKINMIQRIKSLLKRRSKVVSRMSLLRPALPGVSIGHYTGGAGTFGAVVYDRKSGNPLILSNNHVLANTSLLENRNARYNDAIVQPGVLDGKSKQIGRLIKYALLNPYPQANIVDCALAKPLNTKDIKDEILDIGQVKGITEPVIGMKLKKSGRTTGLTTGEVLAVDATIKVNYGSERTLLFENQIIASKMSEPGDSGSLVVDVNNKAVGLLFAGSAESTIINPIDPVLDLLDVRL